VGKGKASKPSKSAAAAGGGGGEGDELAEGGDLEEVDAAAAAVRTSLSWEQFYSKMNIYEGGSTRIYSARCLLRKYSH